jgi:2-oxoisovalerate dehydrogenase E2 component (dihydrolipoyl transacylase)
MKTFHLPDLGEGLAEGEIVKWHANLGDTVKVDDPLVSIETAKAVVEVPSPYTGKITKLYAKEGDIVPTGSALVDFEGVVSQESSTVVGEIKVGEETVAERATSVSPHASGIKVLPAVRALAKKLHVDLLTITPTGADNTITAEDVKNASQTLSAAGPLEPLRGVRRTMALTMMQSHAEVVPVTVVDDVDITAWGDNTDITVNIIRAMIHACQIEPALNVWFDGQAMGRRFVKEVNLGLALDTKEGLFVPVIHQAEQKSAKALREEIEKIKTEVTNRTISVQKLQGATITLSNYGKFAGRYANPIVAVPTVAILGVGAIRESVSFVNGQPTPCKLLPLSLTIDHRAVTGGEATRFLAELMKYLGEQIHVNE